MKIDVNSRDVKLTIGLVLTLLAYGIANAQTSATPFSIVGHIENFCLIDQLKADGACPSGNDARPPVSANAFIEARMVVNRTPIVVPANLVIQMPAAYKTAQEIFSQAKGISRTNNESGLALDDKVPPLSAYEVTVDGNIVCLASGACVYIAGLISLSQQTLNNGAGYIHGFGPDGEIFVGADPAAVTPQPGDTRLRINDPQPGDISTGRYGLSNEQQFPVNLPDARYPDARFQVDQGNPTIHALTGYPMCVPRSVNDPECPRKNRPLLDSTKPFHPVTNKFMTTFITDKDNLVPPVKFGGVIPACPACDPRKQAPFVIGDYVTFAGTLAHDGPVPAAGERIDPARIFISVHTMVANVGIYTKPGVDPAYVALEGSLLGTLGPIALCGGTGINAAECQDRIKVEGFTTDPSRTVNVYAVHVIPPPQPNAGSTVRLLHSTAKEQAVFGRFRWITGKFAGVVVLDGSGATRNGLTREVMVRIDGASGPLADGAPVPTASNPAVANGLIPGVYIAPVGEYIFPEPTAIQGGILPRLNLQCLEFLTKGWTLDGTTSIGQLAPWPGDLSAPVALNCTN